MKSLFCEKKVYVKEHFKKMNRKSRKYGYKNTTVAPSVQQRKNELNNNIYFGL